MASLQFRSIALGVALLAITGCSNSTGSEPTTSASPTPLASGWTIDAQLTSGTLPARPTEGHGCLQQDVVMASGQGTGMGQLDGAKPEPVRVNIGQYPLVATLSPNGPTLRFYALYCSPINAATNKGAAMIDLSVTDESGKAVTITPPDLYATVLASMHQNTAGFSPIFDPATIRLTTGKFHANTLTSSNIPGEFYDSDVAVQPNAAGSDVALSAVSVSAPKGRGEPGYG